MTCMDVGSRAFWQLVGLAGAALTAATLVVACVPMAVTFTGMASQRPVTVLAVTGLAVAAALIVSQALRALGRSIRSTRALRQELAERRTRVPDVVRAVADEVGLARIEVVHVGKPPGYRFPVASGGLGGAVVRP